MWRVKNLIFALLIVIQTRAEAEYRVYRLGIKYHPAPQTDRAPSGESKTENDDKEIEVLTTLDPYQYETYYKITSTQVTRLISHWMCRGRTDYMTPYCLEPPKPGTSTPNSSPGINPN
jgi:hypothetical protein